MNEGSGKYSENLVPNLVQLVSLENKATVFQKD